MEKKHNTQKRSGTMHNTRYNHNIYDEKFTNFYL